MTADTPDLDALLAGLRSYIDGNPLSWTDANMLENLHKALRARLAKLRAERNSLLTQLSHADMLASNIEDRAKAAEAALAECRAVLDKIEAEDDQPECCGNTSGGSFDHPPECCGCPLYGLQRAKAMIGALKKEPRNG